MHLSPMLTRLRESATVGTTRKARELKRAGRDVLVISGGGPDFDTPDHIKEAAIRAIRAGDTKYPPGEGTAELKAAIQAKLARDQGLDYGPAELLVGTGGKQIISSALLATVGPGDEAVIPLPSWVSYPDLVEMAGGKPVFIHGVEADHFKLRADDLARAITPATVWFVINSPCNPTGAVYSAGELRAIADVLMQHPQVMVLSDDIYEYITYDGARFVSLLEVEPALKPRTLLVNGCSKGYCMTGWRIGYGAGPDWLIRAMLKLQGQTTTSTCSIAQAAAAAALTGPHDFVAEHNMIYRRRRDRVVQRINGIGGLACRAPQGAFYVYVNAAGLIGRRTPAGKVLENDLDIADHLLEFGGMAVVPGTGFGTSPYFRLCFAYADEVMADACDRIERAVAALTAA